MIIVPSNLFEQWINEISKFVWDGRPLRRLRARPGSGHVDQSDAGGAQATNEKWLVSTRVPAQDLCYVERLPTVSLQGSAEASANPKAVRAVTFIAQASEVSSADVVICSYRLLYSQIYLKRREAEPEHAQKGSDCALGECSGALRLALEAPGTSSWPSARHDAAQLRGESPRPFSSGRVPLRSGRKGNEMVWKWEDLAPRGRKDSTEPPHTAPSWTLLVGGFPF